MGLVDALGLGSLLTGTGSGGYGSGGAGGGELAASSEGSSSSRLVGRLVGLGSGEDATYSAARCAAEALMDEVQERALWAPFQVR